MNQNGGIHKGGFAVLCHRNGGSESPGILSGREPVWTERAFSGYNGEKADICELLENAGMEG